MKKMRTSKTRLKWYKREGTIESEPLLVGSATVIAEITLDNLSYKIKDLGFPVYYASGQADTLDNVKKVVKERLLRMGAKFMDEVRLKK